MTHSNDSTCRYTDCGAPATTVVSFPAGLAGLGNHTFPYCDKHADEITGDWLVFPGAQRVALPGRDGS